MIYTKIKNILNLKESDDLLFNFKEVSRIRQKELMESLAIYEKNICKNEKIPSLDEFNKIGDLINRCISDLNSTFQETNEIYSMKLKFNTKIDSKKTLKKVENKKIINNINDSLKNNKNQWKMILDFLKVFLSSLKKTLMEKSIKINDTQILALEIFDQFLETKNKIKYLQNNLDLSKSKKDSFDLNPSSFSSSRITFSELRKPLSDENYSWLFKDSTNKKSYAKKTSKISNPSFLKDENVNNRSNSSELFNSSDNDFLSPNEDKLLKIINPCIKKKQSLLSLQKYETIDKTNKKKKSIENISSSRLNIKKQQNNYLKFLSEKVDNLQTK